jgi:hypothetical protein
MSVVIDAAPWVLLLGVLVVYESRFCKFALVSLDVLSVQLSESTLDICYRRVVWSYFRYQRSDLCVTWFRLSEHPWITFGCRPVTCIDFYVLVISGVQRRLAVGGVLNPD